MKITKNKMKEKQGKTKSGKTNALLNLINQQDHIDRFICMQKI